jgi:hypothetical protein
MSVNKEPERFDPFPITNGEIWMAPVCNGKFVKFEDYKASQDRISELEQTLAEDQVKPKGAGLDIPECMHPWCGDKCGAVLNGPATAKVKK